MRFYCISVPFKGEIRINRKNQPPFHHLEVKMLERNLHDTGRRQQRSIQFVKLVYYIPALSFSWSINYSQYVKSKHSAQKKKKKKQMFRGPLDWNATAVYNGSSIYRHLSLPSTSIQAKWHHTHTHAHTQTNTPPFHQFTKGYTPQNTRLARSHQEKGLCNSIAYNLVFHAFLHTKTTTKCNHRS